MLEANGHLQTKSAPTPKADILGDLRERQRAGVCGAIGDVRYGPINIIEFWAYIAIVEAVSALPDRLWDRSQSPCMNRARRSRLLGAEQRLSEEISNHLAIPK
jgi:hypothetical protein